MKDPQSSHISRKRLRDTEMTHCRFWDTSVFFYFPKGPVKLIKWVKIAHSFLVYVRSVPRYHFKLACVILQIAVKEFFETDF